MKLSILFYFYTNFLLNKILVLFISIELLYIEYFSRTVYRIQNIEYRIELYRIEQNRIEYNRTVQNIYNIGKRYFKNIKIQ